MNLARILAVLVAGATPAGPLAAPGASNLPLPPVSAALEFGSGSNDVGLDELLQQLARLTGQELAMTVQAREALRASREPLEHTTPVPAGEVYTFVEGLLSRQGFVIAPITGGTRPILGVLSTGTGRDTGLDPLAVDASALGELAAHPALFVRVLIDLHNSDARQLQTQLRALVVDQSGMQQCVPVGELGLILQGKGRDVASLAKLVLAADEAAGKNHLPAPKDGGTK